MREPEKAVFEAAEHQLATFADRLRSKGITWQPPEHEIWNEDEDTYSSEIRITFLRDGKFHDVFEFQIYRAGELLVDGSQAGEWFREHLDLLTVSN